MIILIHSSKTMRGQMLPKPVPATPGLLAKTEKLAAYICTLSRQEIMASMKVSSKLADEVHRSYQKWQRPNTITTPAAECFLGDIYSGLQVNNWDESDWENADKRLRILSGLYGILKPGDGIKPYRLEMAYRLPNIKYRNLYNFWGKDIASTLPAGSVLVNLAAEEYSKTITPYWDKDSIISPKFLTINLKTGEPTFVVVHAKIARGAFASWLIKNHVTDVQDIGKFNELGYTYSKDLSTKHVPVYICKNFQGLGLSVRLQK